MGCSYNISLVFALSMAILLLSHAHDGNTPEDYVCMHNCLRRVLDYPPMQWDPALANSAQAWADKRTDCKLLHSDRCGESIAGGGNLNGSYAVQMWLDERRNYDHNENKCQSGKMCSHYTQIVWKKTERVGCGRAKCSSENDGWVVVCHYDPPGNVAGELPSGELPPS